jgi:nitrate reductase NapE component
VMSAQQAEDLKMKEKRKREREVIVFLQFNVTIF